MTPVWGLPTLLPPPGPLPGRAEVVIVGAGITGVALLGELVARGVDVIVMERTVHAAGASGRNAGFLLAGVAANYAAAVRIHGRRVAAEVWDFTRENHEMVAALPAAAAAGHRRRGSWTAAIDAREAAELEESAALLGEDGHGVEVAVDPPIWATRVLVNHGDGEIDPLRLVTAMATPHAARLHEATEVVAVDEHRDSVDVRTRDGRTVSAATVVLATNAWTAQLLPTVHIRSVRAQMLAATGGNAAVPVPTYADRGHRYWRQLADGTVLMGGFRDRAVDEEVGFDLTPTSVVQGHLEHQLHDLGVRSAISHRWAGTMGFSADGLPLVGEPRGCRRVAVCAGFTGHGMGFAVHSAQLLAEHLVAAAPLPPWLDASRAVSSPG